MLSTGRQEVNGVAQFYEALCTLAQKGKAVDLLSMTLLLQVSLSCNK